jgi:hypothetical protein
LRGGEVQIGFAWNLNCLLRRLSSGKLAAMSDENGYSEKPRYTWPWFLLAVVVLGLALAIFWMSALVRRTREQRETNPWPPTLQSAPQTNSPAVKTNTIQTMAGIDLRVVKANRLWD